MKKPAYKNFPLDECARALVQRMAELPPGSAFYQKWTCGACGERVTGGTPNQLFENGRHDERADGSPCGYVTDLRKAGCNYAIHMAVGGVASMPGKGNA